MTPALAADALPLGHLGLYVRYTAAWLLQPKHRSPSFVKHASEICFTDASKASSVYRLCEVLRAPFCVLLASIAVRNTTALLPYGKSDLLASDAVKLGMQLLAKLACLIEHLLV